jgi:drug/metabolite transporter (DMT)-like permease
VLTALVATLGAALFGTADFLGGLASRKCPALAVTIASQATGFVVLTVGSLLLGASGDLTRPLTWGVVAGVCGGIGVLALYAGLATGRMSVVAPVTAALSGSVPALVDFASGTTVGPFALAGIALAFVAIVIVSVSGHDQASESAWKALGFALIAGVAFAGSILSYAQTPTSSGLWPLATARVVAVVMLSVAGLVARRSIKVSGDGARIAAFAGAFDAVANAAVVTALRMGPVAVASVLAALYPVGTVVLARVFLHEHVRGWQRAGIVLALVAVVLTAIPA